MTDLWTALALAMAIEGAAYLLFPNGMRRLMMQVLTQPVSTLRTAGLLAMLLGLGVVWLIRG